MSKHTLGPWEWSNQYKSSDNSDTWSLIGADGYGILSCDGEANSPQSCNKADAQLIAAAPELLEALKLADAALEGANMNMDVVKRKVKAAIAKAEGKQ